MSNKRALVCGASQGIGKAIAVALAQKGHTVTLFSRSPEKLQKIVEELPGEGHDFFAGDIGQPDSWQAQLEQKQQDRPYDILICNSGGPASGKISQASAEDFLGAMGNHLVANALLSQIVLPTMRKNKWGRIISVTSTSVKVPIPHLGVSNTARAAVATWAKTLSLEVAADGVTVNNVMPGFTKTPRLEKLMEAKAKNTGQTVEQVRQAWLKLVPMGRFCKPQETAALVEFMVSDAAGAITGQNIAVDGGRLGCL